MISADTYRVQDTLKNGVAVTIRAIRPDDKKRIAKAFKNLERESIYTRFFRFKSYLTDEELRSVTEVDFENVVALVVTVGEGEGETIIGAGRYALYDSSDVSRSAEIAFTVEEDYHGQGIASRLLTSLAHIAREKGVSQFEAEVLPENRPMLAVFARSGLPMRKPFGDGVVHVTLSLTEKTS
jgi:RimJ/RimL family protein N-acetyltransferase